MFPVFAPEPGNVYPSSGIEYLRLHGDTGLEAGAIKLQPAGPHQGKEAVQGKAEGWFVLTYSQKSRHDLFRL